MADNDNTGIERAKKVGRSMFAMLMYRFLKARLLEGAPLDNSNPSIGVLILCGIKKIWGKKDSRIVEEDVPPELAQLYNTGLPANGEIDYETVNAICALPAVEPFIDELMSFHPGLKPSALLVRRFEALRGGDLRPESFDASVIEAIFGIEKYILGLHDGVAALRDEMKWEIKAATEAIIASQSHTTLQSESNKGAENNSDSSSPTAPANPHKRKADQEPMDPQGGKKPKTQTM